MESRVVVCAAAGPARAKATLASNPINALFMLSSPEVRGTHRRGIGGRLIREGLRRAGEAGFTAVIVLGHADYYPKFGFAPAAKWGITTLYDVPEEVFMAMELKSGALDDASGTVVYPEAFERV